MCVLGVVYVDTQKSNMESMSANGLQCLIAYIYLIIY
jgi:hypothetical protein